MKAATPASASGARSSRFHGTSPPHRGIVGPTLALGGAKLKLQRLNVRRGGNCVEWHFDKGSDAACNHGLRAGFITFPFGAARFAHMHVGVDHARHHILA